MMGMDVFAPNAAGRNLADREPMENPNVYNTDETYLSADDAKRFIDAHLRPFKNSERLGPAGVLQQADIAFLGWKLLSPHDFDRFESRLYRYDELMDFWLLRELGRRRAKANAVTRRFTASAELHILSQPAAAFDGFLDEASRDEARSAYQLRSRMVEQRTSPRQDWLGLLSAGRE
jgi:hypothetical protein